MPVLALCRGRFADLSPRVGLPLRPGEWELGAQVCEVFSVGPVALEEPGQVLHRLPMPGSCTGQPPGQPVSRSASQPVSQSASQPTSLICQLSVGRSVGRTGEPRGTVRAQRWCLQANALLAPPFDAPHHCAHRPWPRATQPVKE